VQPILKWNTNLKIRICNFNNVKMKRFM